MYAITKRNYMFTQLKIKEKIPHAIKNMFFVCDRRV